MKIEVQISDNNNAAHLLVIVDKKEADIKLTEEELHTALSNKGINTGIDSAAIKQIISDKIYNKPVCAANGVPPKAVENARVEILKKPKKKSDITAPKTDDGGVDYYSPREGFLVYVRKGDVLAVKYPPTVGETGKNIFGETVPGLLGKEISLELFTGRNTVIKKNQIIAEADGILELDGLQINVLNVYEISDNIGKSTGSIDIPRDLNCKLIVKGDVQRGYKVFCSDLYVQGCIENAVVTAKNLEVKEGIVGVGKQKVTADNILVGYINGSREIHANTIIVLREISNGAKVYSNVVKAHTIQGSEVIGKDAIWADYINGNNTIFIGIDYRAKLEQDELHKRILAMDSPIEELKKGEFLNAKRMRKLAELARVNPKHPMLRKEIPKIKEAKEKLDDSIKKKIELIKKREKIASEIYSKRESFLFVRSNFGKDSSGGYIVDPSITINIRGEIEKINDITPGGIFTLGPHGISHSLKYNIKEIRSKFDDYFNASKDAAI